MFYRKLKARNLQLELERDELQGQLDKLQDKIISSFVSLDGRPIKRAIVGKQGTGKTHYIQNVIIPQLDKVGKDYFIFDTNNEYQSLSAKNKFADTALRERRSFFEILHALPHPSPLVIMENAQMYSIKDMRGMVLEPRNNVLLVFPCIADMMSMGHLFDYIYLFETNDSTDLFCDFYSSHPVIDMLGYNENNGRVLGAKGKEIANVL